MVEVTDPPGGGAPLHVHHGEAEAFYLLDGTIALACGDEKVVARAGDFIYAPKDVPILATDRFRRLDRLTVQSKSFYPTSSSVQHNTRNPLERDRKLALFWHRKCSK